MSPFSLAFAPFWFFFNNLFTNGQKSRICTKNKIVIITFWISQNIFKKSTLFLSNSACANIVYRARRGVKSWLVVPERRHGYTRFLAWLTMCGIWLLTDVWLQNGIAPMRLELTQQYAAGTACPFLRLPSQCKHASTLQLNWARRQSGAVL
jgi:hypothetical protein